MDELGRVTLRAEIDADGEVLVAAAAVARARFGNGSPPELEACAFQLVRFYNVVEQMALRVAKAFENHIDDERGWHTELLRRLALTIPGVRPAFFPGELALDLQDLRGFRHIAVHAYDLTLRKEKLAPLVESAERLAKRLPDLIAGFFEKLPA